MNSSPHSERQMNSTSLPEITILLHAWGNGDEDALHKLTEIVYEDLYLRARRYMFRERSGHFLQNTALVNETYLRLVDLRGTDWQDRNHFFGVCCQLMQHILADYARERLARKRGGNLAQTLFTEHLPPSRKLWVDPLELQEALAVLGRADSRARRVVELRFFVGLTIEETAEVLQVSTDTVKRDWRFAKHWLLQALTGKKANGN
jgi:RNA polymerase sigma-70 factor, ECF subfamily